MAEDTFASMTRVWLIIAIQLRATSLSTGVFLWRAALLIEVFGQTGPELSTTDGDGVNEYFNEGATLAA